MSSNVWVGVASPHLQSFRPGEPIHRDRGQFPDRVDALGDVAGDDPALVDQERHRRREDPVFLGQLPSILDQHGELEPLGLGLAAVLLGVAAADQDDGRVAVAALLVQADQ